MSMPEIGKNDTNTGLEIAVIGMAGRFPGAGNLEEFWENLKNGVESVTFLNDKELIELGVEPGLLENPGYVKAIGSILDDEDKARFDAAFFGYNPAEAEIINPQLRLFLQCAWEALENAGYPPDGGDTVTGLYAGASDDFYWRALSIYSPRKTELGEFAASLLTDKDFIPTQISYKLNLRGPSILVKATCSTSLVAIHLACQAILNSECYMALAGGITLRTFRGVGYLYQEGMIASPDGHCRAFDAEAKGANNGEGIGIVVLKFLEDAINDGDYINAVIKSSTINNDGNQKAGYAAPSVLGQAETIRIALKLAEVEPESIGYIETHGTGTTVGDPIEIEALKLAFNSSKKGYCRIGSVKTNIGHLDAAAGVVGFLKAVLVLKHRLIPPTLHYTKPNPRIDFKNSPFIVNNRLVTWNNDNKYPRRAGVSSFGIGGANAHVILEEWLGEPSSNPRTTHQGTREMQLILLSAKTQSTLERMTENLSNYFKKNLENHKSHANHGLADVAYSLQVGRKAFPHRRMLVCPDVNEAIDSLSSGNPRKIHTFFIPKQGKSRVVFVFVGLGSQYVNMGLDLYKTEPVFRDEMDRCFEILEPLLGYDLKAILYPDNLLEGMQSPSLPPPASASAPPLPAIHQFEIAQVSVFILEYALARLLLKWGIKPYAMIGYSFGEYTAACLSGVFTLKDALNLIVARAKLIRKLPAGAMLSVPLTREELTPLLRGELSLAIDNGPSCIAAGPPGEIETFEKQMKENKILCVRLQASRALHSRMMEPILKEFTEIVAQFPLNKPQIPYISNVSGDFIADEAVITPAYWASHLKETVQFNDGIKKLANEENVIFVEIGPGRDLSTLLSRYIENRPTHRVVNLLRPPAKKVSDVYYLLDRLGRLWGYGVEIDWNGFYSHEKRYRIPLPTYPFQEQRYPFPNNLSRVIAENMQGKSHLQTRPEIDDWFYIPSWERSLLPTAGVDQKKPEVRPSWLVFTDQCHLTDRLLSLVRQEEADIITVKIDTEFKKEKDTYMMDPRQGEHYDIMFKKLRESNRVPEKILHFWGVNWQTARDLNHEEIYSAFDTGLFSLLNIAQAIGRNSINSDIEILVVTNNMQEITRKEGECPEKAVILGAVKVIPLEYLNIKCRSIDIDIHELSGHQDHENNLPRLLLEEFMSGAPDVVVAYRGDYRWLQAYKPHPLPPVNKLVPPLREKGVYLITGGFGGMGFTLAEHLAEVVKARLILVGRSPFPDRDQWQEWLENHGQEDSVSQKIRKIQEFEKKGARVMVACVDVSDYEQMKKLVARAEKQLGQINGVLHTAAIIDYDGVIQRRTRQMTENGMKAKIKGTLVLNRLLKDVKTDFLVLFSSLGNIIYGGKFGQVAYNSSNEFLDAFTLYKSHQRGRFVLAINWTDWKEVGMAVKAISRVRGDASELDSPFADVLTPSQGVEVFDRILASGLSRVAISTKDLPAWIEEEKKGKNKESYNIDMVETSPPPATLYQRPELSTEYAAPRNEIERKLSDIFQNFFGIEAVGIHDDFFELGGDSLTAITVARRLHKELNVEIPIIEFFNSPTIEKLAEYINQAAEITYIPIEPIEKKEYYPLSSAQKRFYILQQMDPQSTSYINSAVLALEGKLEKDKVERILIKIVDRHESFRTSFHFIKEEPVQKVHQDINITMEYHETSGPAAKNITANFTKPFNLATPPLLRVRLIKLEELKHVCVFVTHHIISDGLSFNIFIKDLVGFYLEKEIPPLRLQYKDFSQWQQKRLISGKLKEQEKYWLDNFSGELPVLNIPTDYPRPAVQSFEGDTISFRFEKGLKQELNQLMKETGTTLFMMMLALYNVLLANYTWKKDIIVGTTIAGRNHADLQNIIGLLIETIVIRNYPEGDKTFEDFLAEVKVNTLNAFENQGYPYGELLKHFENQFDESRNPLFDTMLIVQNIEGNREETGIEELKVVPYEEEVKKVSKLDITIEVSEWDDFIPFKLEYCTKLFKKQTMETFAASFKEIISTVVENKKIKLKDIKISYQLRAATASVYDETESEFEF